MKINDKQFSVGFGERLRLERKRLNLTQDELGSVAGVQRLAQRHYEIEARTPNVNYLFAISKAGVDIYYVIFGKKVLEEVISLPQLRDAESKAFVLIEEYVEQRCEGKLSAEARAVLFDLFRKQLLSAKTLANESKQHNL